MSLRFLDTFATGRWVSPKTFINVSFAPILDHNFNKSPDVAKAKISHVVYLNHFRHLCIPRSGRVIDATSDPGNSATSPPLLPLSPRARDNMTPTNKSRDPSPFESLGDPLCPTKHPVPTKRPRSCTNC